MSQKTHFKRVNPNLQSDPNGDSISQASDQTEQLQQQCQLSPKKQYRDPNCSQFQPKQSIINRTDFIQSQQPTKQTNSKQIFSEQPNQKTQPKYPSKKLGLNQIIESIPQARKQQFSSCKIENFVQIQEIAERRPLHILAISDNHGDYKMMNQILGLKGDIFIHAGDFTYHGKDDHFQKFFQFLDKVQFRHKIVLSGNHENVLSKLKLQTNTKISRDQVLQELKKRCKYLEHQSIQIQGIKIFASPFTPEYCQKPTSRAFQYKPSHDKVIWSSIPQDTQLLITHGPPYKILDSGKGGKRAGSQALGEKVKAIKPKYHIFGHIHQSKGMYKDEHTTYINLCNSPTRFLI